MECYILDADTVINLQRHYPSALKKLRSLVAAGQIKMPEGTYREVVRNADKAGKLLKRWANKYPEFLVQFDKQANPGLLQELARIERAYGADFFVGKQQYRGFWKSRAGQKAADGQVVAAAKELICVAVSDDKAVEGACLLEGVACIGWTEFLRRVNQVVQLSLFPSP